jgi:hypothetical protein
MGRESWHSAWSERRACIRASGGVVLSATLLCTSSLKPKECGMWSSSHWLCTELSAVSVENARASGSKILAEQWALRTHAVGHLLALIGGERVPLERSTMFGVALLPASFARSGL